MVIQRWQTLLLLLAVALMGVFCFVPYGQIEAANGGESVRMVVHDAPVLLTVNLLIAALLFVAIFLYKNLKLQMKVTILSMVLICASAATSLFMVFNNGASIVWAGGVLLLLVALLAAYRAYRLMGCDYRLLHSSDRLR